MHWIVFLGLLFWLDQGDPSIIDQITNTVVGECCACQETEITLDDEKVRSDVPF